jgi:hypothetical protein
MQRIYPDISDILSAKARRRSALVAMSWEEKVAIIEQMQKLLPKGLWRDRSPDERILDQRGADDL